MWTIVHFQVDNSVDFIPDFWLNKGLCAWPKKRANIHSFVEKRVDPDVKPEEFNYFDARILYKNIDDISEARLKAKKAQDTSDLSSQTDYGDNETKKNKLNSTKHGEQSKTAKLPVPPTFIDSEESNGDDSDVDKTYTPKFQLNVKTQPINDEDSITPKQSMQTYGSSHKKLKFDYQTHFPSTSQTFLNRFDELQSPTQPINDEQEDKFKGLRGVERNIIVIKHEIKNFHDRLDSVIKMQENILGKLSNQPYTTASNDDFENDNIIYIDNDINFDIMENKLSNDKLFRNNVVKELSRLSGSNLSETIRKIMQKLFSDKILSGYSYIGFKGKKTFSTLQTCGIIFESIRKMKSFKDATDNEIEKPLKNWMGQATPRLKKLAQKNIATDEETM